MSADKIACIILAAGRGSRMKSSSPKPLHKIAGFPMVSLVIKAAEDLGAEKIIPVIAPDMQDVADAVLPHGCAVQGKPLGTGHAVLSAKDELEGFEGDVVILYCDTPLITVDSIQKLINARRASDNIGIAVSVMTPPDPGHYGRIIMNEDDTLDRIVEYNDATDEEKKITLCNGGIMCIDARHLFDWLSEIKNENAKGEYYLVDLPQIAAGYGKNSIAVEIPYEDVEGINTRQDLARLEGFMQDRLRRKALNNGVTLIDPQSVTFAADTELGQDVTIHPCVVFGPGVRIEDNVEIKSFSHLEGAEVQSGSSIGPHGRLRPGTKIGKNSKVGSFVEVKNSVFGEGVKANHLSYIGDAEIGDHTNVGAGVITANYDGFDKYKTIIGKDVMIGVNANLIAPITISDGAFIAGGSTLSKNVPKDSLAVERGPNKIKQGWAKAFRERKEKAKTASPHKNISSSMKGT